MLWIIKQTWEQGSIYKDKQMLWITFTMAYLGFMHAGEFCAHSLTNCNMATI